MREDLYYQTGHKFVLTEKGEEELRQDYALGYSQIKIAKKFEVSEDTVRRWMKVANIPTRKRRHNINEHYFQKITSPEQAYWLGFLSADGYVHNGRGELTLELQESDKEHIEKFRKAISSEHPIIPIKTGIDKQFLHYRLSFKCAAMVRDLSMYNIIQNKSLIFYPVNIPQPLFQYWILGYMDGDGCIFKCRKRFKISFTGTYETLTIIKNYFNSSNTIRREHKCKNNTFNFTLEVDLCEKFLQDVQYDKLDFVLKRKQMRYCSFIQ